MDLQEKRRAIKVLRATGANMRDADYATEAQCDAALEAFRKILALTAPTEAGPPPAEREETGGRNRKERGGRNRGV